ncbi:MAG: transposase [Aquirhabdus sp.]
MSFNPDRHHRRSIRLKHYDYSQAGLYFITLCTHQRLSLFGDVVAGEMQLNEMGRVVQDVWQDLPNHYTHVELDCFVVMPNHVHGIVRFNGDVRSIHQSPTLQAQISRRNMGLPKLVGRLKMVSAKRINQLRENQGVPVWQRNYHEHIIRHENAHIKIADYIHTNPLRWQEDTYYV